MAGTKSEKKESESIRKTEEPVKRESMGKTKTIAFANLAKEVGRHVRGSR